MWDLETIVRLNDLEWQRWAQTHLGPFSMEEDLPELRRKQLEEGVGIALCPGRRIPIEPFVPEPCL